MGLNEVALGIAVPECWGALMAQRIGAGAADKMLQFARLVSPQEALKLGLVDQVGPDASCPGSLTISLDSTLCKPFLIPFLKTL